MIAEAMFPPPIKKMVCCDMLAERRSCGPKYCLVMSARIAIRELFSGESLGSSCMSCTINNAKWALQKPDLPAILKEGEAVLQCCAEKHPFYFILAVTLATLFLCWLLWVIFARKSGTSFVVQVSRLGDDFVLNILGTPWTCVTRKRLQNQINSPRSSNPQRTRSSNGIDRVINTNSFLVRKTS